MPGIYPFRLQTNLDTGRNDDLNYTSFCLSVFARF